MCSTFKHLFQTWTTQTHTRGRTHTDSPVSWCRWGLSGRPRGNERGRSRTPYTPDYCWPECCVQPSLCARSSCQTGTSCLLRCRAACQPAGSLWTAHHWAGRGREQMTRINWIVNQGCMFKGIYVCLSFTFICLMCVLLSLHLTSYCNIFIPSLLSGRQCMVWLWGRD